MQWRRRLVGALSDTFSKEKELVGDFSEYFENDGGWHLSGPHSTSPGPAAGNIIHPGARGPDHMSNILQFKGVCPI